MSILLITLIIIVCVFIALGLYFKTPQAPVESKATSRALTAWAKQVKFSEQQKQAMRLLWAWHVNGEKPGADPLKALSTAELADLLSKCAIEYVPEHVRYPGEEQLRRQMLVELGRKGIDEMHAQVLTGMKFGSFGPLGE